MPSSKKEKKKDRDDDDSPPPSDDEPEVKKDKKDKKEKKEKKDKKKTKREPQCLCCEVVDVKAVPNKNNLRICEVSLGEPFDGMTAHIVTNATNVSEGDRTIVALDGVKVQTENGSMTVEQRKVGGVESEGMLCGPVEMGWSTEVLPADRPVILPHSAEPGEPVVPYEDCVAFFKSKQPVESKDTKTGSTKDKKKDQKAAKAAAKAADDDEFEKALAAEGAEPAATEAAKDKNKKKKAAKGAKAAAKAADDDEFEKALAAEGAEPAATEAAKAKDEDAAEAREIKQVEEHIQQGADHTHDDGKDDEVVDAKTLANRKKKEKALAKKKAKAAADGQDEDKQAPAEAPSSSSGGPKKAVSGKSKIEELRKQAELRRRLQEEKEEFDRKERERLIEEKRQEEEEIRQAQERRAARIAKKKQKIDAQKADGTYIDKKEKERRKRAEILKAQFGFDADADPDESSAKPKSAPAGKLKKKLPTKQPGDLAEPVQAAEEPKEGEVEQQDTEEGDWEELAAEENNEGGTVEEQESAEESQDESDDSFLGYRSPIICIMGHVDTGKTKLLDKIRRTNVQEGEAGGITQQIGATFFPNLSLQEQTDKVDPDFDIDVPGMLIIDTPGHESFNNLRTRGSSLCDIAILVIDIMHGLEPQTVESLEILKKRKCPFIIALNKVDRLHGWRSEEYTGIRSALERQDQSVIDQFEKQWARWNLQLQQRGLNCYLYWDNIANDTVASCVSVVPTSALTGEGVPDLLYMLLNCCQTMMPHKLEVKEELECTVIEVKNIEGLGTTIDVVLVNGTLKEGDRIVINGLGGVIDTTIRALLTPQPLREMRVRNDYVHHPKISTSMGIKIVAPDLDNAVAGSELRVIGPEDDPDEIKEEVEDGFESALADFEKQPEGVYVKASTLGSLEALLSFLTDSEIPVAEMGIGDVQKKDVRRAAIQKSKSHPEYAMIMAFDVKVNNDAKQEAEKEKLPIFTADIIYHLFDKFNTHMDNWRAQQREELKDEAVFPVIMKVDKTCVFRRNDPLILGCDIVGGQLRVGTPLCVPDMKNLEIGRVAGIEKDKRQVDVVRKGARVCVKIEQNTAQKNISYGRQFDHTNSLYSKISRSSIDALKAQFKEEMKPEDWQLIIGMKKLFEIP